MFTADGGSIPLTDHQNLENKLGRIAERIKNQGKKRQFLAETLKKAKNQIEISADEEKSGIVESELVHPVQETPLENLVIAGVDGGVLSKPLHGLDLILLRSVGTVFYYEEEELKEADYHPSERPIPQLINIHEPMDSRELDIRVGLERQLVELDCANEIANNREIDALMLDGSIVPQYVNHASSDKSRKLYKKLINSFTNLYQTCTEKEILLLGAVKDSRSARLASIFQKKIFPKLIENSDLSSDELSSLNKNMDVLTNSRDTAFLDYLLEAGERTFVFNYAEAPANLLENLGDWSNRIRAFYMKPVPYDRPVRVEFISNQKDVVKKTNKIASLVTSLSARHEACALPSVLIEADARAALAKEEISILRDKIADQLEPSTLLDLRRERRPF